MTTPAPEHLYLIDGSSYIFRAYHALPPLTRDDGTPVNAVMGFCNMLFKLLQDLEGPEQPTHLAVIFDAARKTFRNDIFPDYKAHRPPAPEDLVPQFSIIRESVRAFNVPAIDSNGFEADDIIATYATQAASSGYTVTIVSSDKDLMQLVGDQVTMLDSMKNRHIGVDEVFEKFGVTPDRVIDVQALAGDSSDNVPGVPGIGVKTAAQLIHEYGDLDNLLDRADEIKQPKRRQNLQENADLARISRDLVTLRCDVPDLPPLDSMKLHSIEVERLMPFLEEQNFRALQSKVISHMGGQSAEHLSDEAREIAPDSISYETVTTTDRLQYWIDEAYKAGQVTLDTETTDLNAMRARLVGISLSIEAGKACYIPLAHVGETDGELSFDGGQAPDQIDQDTALAMLKPLLVDPSVLKIGQNIKYDLLVLRNVGLNVTPYDDTMLLSYTLDSGRGGHGMDELAEKHLDHKTIPFKDIVGTGKKQITFDRVPLDKATEYAAEDADITGRLHRLLKPRLAKESMTTVYETLERPMPSVLAGMECEGVKVDRAILSRLSTDFAGRLDLLEQQIHDLVGHTFNIASPKQLGDVLFGELGLPGGKKSKTGAYSTNADVLEGLAAEGHELPARVLDWRQLAKLKSTYTDALQKQINPDTGRIHTSYSLAGTTTGRLASTEPNLQNIPIRTEEGRKIRQAFIAEPGHKLMAADYSQIELRLLAHIADLDSLKDAFHHGHDIHAMTASQVFGVPLEGMDPIVRRQAKAINFGIIYGISAFGLARQLGISRTEAKNYIDAYFEKFPGIQKYMEDTKVFCRDHSYVETIFGRRCHISGIQDKNGAKRAFAERAAINAPIQGAAADIIRRAMIRLPSALTDANLNARMLLQVHDELVFEVPDDEMDQTITVVKDVMENAAHPALQLSVPLIVDAGVGDNWDEAH
ncbi:MAG: DNA polymerase I [Kordiimonas sp.]|nr:DNA polymerase I [Kordiimonas sp.]|tara:strand:- start:691 stop:3471 length:2781 start_codon:yes stop_codon:yes gene_type:complete